MSLATTRRLLALTAVLIGAAILALCIRGPQTDESKFRAMHQEKRHFVWLVSAEKGPYGPLLRPLRLSDRYLKNWRSQCTELKTSGYLTNASFTVSNAPVQRLQIIRKLDSATAGTDIMICDVAWMSNTIAITCRPKDIAPLSQALAQ